MARQRTDNPNVIVFFTDQQRWDTTGVHGNPLGLTPNFDRMAATGTHLYHTFTCQPLCGPARSVMQTGLYPTTTGCYTNRQTLPPQAVTLAECFNEAGYKTGYIGKWHLSSCPPTAPVPEAERGGYREWLAANALELVSDAYNTVLYDNDNHPQRLPGYRVDALADAAIRFIDQHKQDPFLLFLSFLEPHHQNDRDDYPPPLVYRETYANGWIPPDLAVLGGSSREHLSGYYGMVRRLDEALGRVQDALVSLGLSEDTIVLFTSDHACHFKTRNEEYKRSCHESSIRVPTAFSGPGFDRRGQIRELVSLIDLPPTLLDAAGIPVPPAMQGRSLMPLVRGSDPRWPDDVFIQISVSQVGRAIRTKRWKYGVTAPDKDGRTDIGSSAYVEEYLYDLQADPYELNNLCSREEYRQVAEELQDRLLRRMVQAGEKLATVARF
jgi:arylsulfatase A-like enzyme